jgi:hypothetical protein
VTSVRFPAAPAGRFSRALRRKAAFALHARPLLRHPSLGASNGGWWFGAQKLVGRREGRLRLRGCKNGAADERSARPEGASLYVKTSGLGKLPDRRLGRRNPDGLDCGA